MIGRIKECDHNKSYFCGSASLVRGYYCPKCRLVIDPIVFHKILGYPHIYFHPDHKKELEECIRGLDEENLRLWNQ